MNVELIRNKPGDEFTFIIEGQPNTKQSVRIMPQTEKDGSAKYEFKADGKKKVKMAKFQDKDQMNKEVYAKWCIKGQLPFGFELWDGPIAITKLHYVFYPPKKYIDRVNRKELVFVTTRPDMTDNLNKLVFDAMKKIVYLDDSQIVVMDNLMKYYGLQPRTIITLRKIS